MNRMFCTNCGTKMEYSYSKPKFCHNCGSKCGESVNLQAKKEILSKSDPLQDDETSIDELPDIRSLAVETESHGNNVFSFESLVDQEVKNNTSNNKGSRNIEDFIDAKRKR